MDPGGFGWLTTVWKDGPEFLWADALGELETSQGEVKTLRCQEALILW